jgi:hypothetical protein
VLIHHVVSVEGALFLHRRTSRCGAGAVAVHRARLARDEARGDP